MKEETFRLYLIILLSIFVTFFILIGFRLSGRYEQLDGPNYDMVDTQTGKVIRQPEL